HRSRRCLLGCPGPGGPACRGEDSSVGEDSAPSRAVARWLARRLPALLRRYGVEAAYLFGSWARGEADRLSDIDLIVVARSHRPFVDRFRDFPELLRAPAGIELSSIPPTSSRACGGRTASFVTCCARQSASYETWTPEPQRRCGARGSCAGWVGRRRAERGVHPNAVGVERRRTGDDDEARQRCSICCSRCFVPSMRF